MPLCWRASGSCGAHNSDLPNIGQLLTTMRFFSYAASLRSSSFCFIQASCCVYLNKQRTNGHVMWHPSEVIFFRHFSFDWAVEMSHCVDVTREVLFESPSSSPYSQTSIEQEPHYNSVKIKWNKIFASEEFKIFSNYSARKFSINSILVVFAITTQSHLAFRCPRGWKGANCNRRHEGGKH